MRKRMYRLARSLSIRPDTGAILAQRQIFSSGLVADTQDAYVPISDEEVIAAAFQILAAKVPQSNVFASPRPTREYLVTRIAGLEYEVFCCMYLNNRYRLIAFEELFRGTFHGANVHVREVLKQALKYNAAALVIAHNHPSGSTDESDADRRITRQLKSALELVDIKLVDHLIVGGAEVVSMAEKGLL